MGDKGRLDSLITASGPQAVDERMNFILLDQAAADRRAAEIYNKLCPTLNWTAAAQGLLDAMRSVKETAQPPSL